MTAPDVSVRPSAGGPGARDTRAGAGLVHRAVRNRPGRAAVAVAGIAIGTLLVLVLAGAFRALTHGVRSYVGSEGIDLWIAPRGTDNLIRSSALLPSSIMDSIAALPSVHTIAPLLRGFVSVGSARHRGNDAGAPGVVNLLAIGYRAPNGLGGPPALVRGRLATGPAETVLDRAAAHRLAVSPGDTVSVNTVDFTLVGISTDTNLMATQFAFFDLTALERTSGFHDQFSFLAVGLEPGAAPDDLARSIAVRVPQVAVYTREQFVTNNIREVATGFRPMQLLVSGMGVLAVAVLIALLVQGGVDDRRQDVAVLVAMGAQIRSIASGVILHTTTLVFLGAVVGGALTWVLQAALLRYLPTVELAPRLSDLVFAVPLLAAVSWLAASLPLLRLRKIDPVTAFRP